MEKKYFFELVDKYLSVETNAEEDKLLVSFYDSFQTDLKWDESLGSKEAIKVTILNRLQNAIDEEEVPLIPIKKFYQSTIIKLAIAASIVLLISIPLVFNKNNSRKENKTAVVTNNIKIGTDKATLTLGDGSVIILEKGKAYTAENIKSNGEELVYNSKNNKAKIDINFLTIPRGGQFFVQLPDSTKVWLNSESQLKYPVAFVAGETRQVELVYGEAYFEVSPSSKHKGDKFNVKTKEQNVEVIGTEFNIKAYRNEANIFTTLVKGKVAICNADIKQFLAPNQQSKLNLQNNSLNITNVDVYSETSWRKGLFAFKSMPLKEIMKVLSRWYDVDIKFVDEKQGNIKFNGVLSKNQKLEEILTTIMNTNFINGYDIKNKTVILK